MSFKAIRESKNIAKSIQFKHFPNAEIITQIQGKLLKRALVLINCLPFKKWESVCSPGSQFFPLRVVTHGMKSMELVMEQRWSTKENNH